MGGGAGVRRGGLLQSVAAATGAKESEEEGGERLDGKIGEGQEEDWRLTGSKELSETMDCYCCDVGSRALTAFPEDLELYDTVVATWSKRQICLHRQHTSRTSRMDIYDYRGWLVETSSVGVVSSDSRLRTNNGSACNPQRWQQTADHRSNSRGSRPWPRKE